MDQLRVRLHRWDEIALDKVTEMISRKIVTGEREMVAQIYLKRGALVPMHKHESEQMTYILQGALKFLIDGEDIIVREGEVLHIPSWVPHQAEALEDTFEIDIFSSHPAGLARWHRRLLPGKNEGRRVDRWRSSSRLPSGFCGVLAIGHLQPVGRPASNQVLHGWRQVDVQLRRRHDVVRELSSAPSRTRRPVRRGTLDAVTSAAQHARRGARPAPPMPRRRNASCRRRSAALFAIARDAIRS